MIPVLAIPVINRPDLLRVCLASIDEPVGRLIVIDNSGTGELGDVAAEVRPDAIVVDPPSNLGVAGSWNFTIKTSPAAPWWCLVNADVAFAPGDLARLAVEMETADLACLVEFGAFGISGHCIDLVGWFDENFHPIYCEDTDYRRRCDLANVAIATVPSQARHAGSVSWKDDPAGNNRTYPENVAYYRAKWGRNAEYATPFGRGGPVSEWELDLSRIRDLAW